MEPEQYAGYTPEEPEYGGSYHQTAPSSAYVERRQPTPDATPYPFQVTATPALLKSAPGLLGSASIASQEKANPANGVHYLLAKVIINSTTGAITSSTVEWVTTVPTNTTTNYHLVIAEILISSGSVAYAYQFTFGPISVVIGGGFNSVWAARLL